MESDSFLQEMRINYIVKLYIFFLLKRYLFNFCIGPCNKAHRLPVGSRASTTCHAWRHGPLRNHAGMLVVVVVVDKYLVKLFKYKLITKNLR